MTDTTSGNAGLIGYFGYGSLVNRDTLRTEIVAAYPARVTGWRRVWLPRPANAPKFAGVGPAVLTVERAEGHAIDGMLVIDRVENIASVDERENIYRRVSLTSAALTFYGDVPPADIPLHIYERNYEPEVNTPPSPILRSYLDAVFQGYFRAFGEDGLRRFVTETSGFGLPIHEDRHAPAYPRAIELTSDEGHLFDAVMGGVMN